MMGETANNVVTYTPLESGDSESRWIRLEQVQATLPGPPLVAAAELVDMLFDIEPCDDGMGGGGDEAGEGPDEEKVEEELSLLLERNGQCLQGYWLAALNVYRTHKTPNYELRSETAKVETVEAERKSYRQVVDVSGPLIALDMPYDGNLQGIPAGVNWTVRGATVNLDRPVHDRLILRYDTWYERVTLRVPTKRTDDGEEYESAAVVAFWGDMAAECALEPPEAEDAENQAAKRRLCNRLKPEEPEPGDCWKTIKHYQLCECSKKRINEWEGEESAPCDGFPAGAYVGFEEKFGGYVGGWICGDDEYDRELQSPAYYKKKCCKPLPFSPSRLPLCRTYYAVYRGGAGIEHGPEHWRNIYGADVRMVAVMPKDGICGEVITRWNIPSKNCCDEADPMTPDPDNPTEIVPGHTYWIAVEGGAPGWIDGETTWEAFGGLEFVPGGETRIVVPHGTTRAQVHARDDVCPSPSVHVDDGCSSVTMTFSGQAGDGPELSDDSLAVGRGQQFSMSVSGGVGPYMWQASSGIEVLGWSADGSTAYFRADTEDWCVATVTAVDQCGREDECEVRQSDTGTWVAVPSTEYDPCSPPGAPYPPADNETICYASSRTSRSHGGYYAIYTGYEQQSMCETQGARNCPAGTEIVSGYFDKCVKPQCEKSGGEWVDNCCINKKTGNPIRTVSQKAIGLYRWVCG